MIRSQISKCWVAQLAPVRPIRAWFLALLMFGGTALAQDSIPSPDGQYLADLSRNPTHGIGKRLFLRYSRGRHPGRLLIANDRSMDAQWSPDSRFLAVTNYTDPHISVVLVFGIRNRSTAEPDAPLLFISPSPGVYDTKWAVSG
jgi:hypothetical protein